MLMLFVISVLFCVYTYALYPVWLAWRVHRETAKSFVTDIPVVSLERQSRSWPTVSIVIAAHNEERFLESKLSSLAALDYPADALQIVVVSDGSTDGTLQVLEQSAVTYDHYSPSMGKPTALNRALELAIGDIVVFMDARQTISPNALTALVARFDDPTIGVVSGELMIAPSRDSEKAKVGLYWRYEKWIRQNESQLFSTTGATGALYAIRRADIRQLEQDVLLDDFDIPIQTLAQGKRTVFEPEALAIEVNQHDVPAEFQRKVRTLAGNFQSFSRQRWLFDPRRNPVCWQFVSHKVFRLLVPVALMLAFISSALGQGWLLNTALVLQILFYLTGFLGSRLPVIGNLSVVTFVGVFLRLNLAVVVGAWRYFTGSYTIRWKSVA